MLAGDGLPKGSTDLVTLKTLLAVVWMFEERRAYALTGLEVNLLREESTLAGVSSNVVLPPGERGVLLTLRRRAKTATWGGETYNLTHVGGLCG